MEDNVIKMPTKEKEKEKSFLEVILNSVTGGENNGLDQMSAVLNLPDKEFKVLSTFMIGELEKQLNSTSARLGIIASLEAEGVAVEDLASSFDEINTAIDDQLSGTLNQPRRDFLKQIVSVIINSAMEEVGTSKRQIKVGIEMCHPDAIMPEYATPGDSGMDVFAVEDVEIGPGETKLVHTGIKVEIPLGYEIQVRPKSGRCLKTKMRVANAPGTVDAPYRGEVCVIIDNIEPPIKDITYDFDSNGQPIITSILHGESFFISKGEKIAQLVLAEVPKIEFYNVEHVNENTERGSGGFGSTGLTAKS